jgi:4-hydroxybenzoate polyprenyltransferase
LAVQVEPAGVLPRGTVNPTTPTTPARGMARPVIVHPGRTAAFIRLLRPRQWIKNTFVLAPLIFSGTFIYATSVERAIIATALFCIASSATYVFNDLTDRAADAAHPTKSRTRPIASGDITPAQARILLAGLYVIVAASALWSVETAAVAVAYLVLNAAYTVKLKHIPVVDIFALAGGFVLRVFCGAVAIGVPLSLWMLITTLCLALYLAAVKRRDELVATGGSARSVLRLYTVRLLDRYAEMSALSAVVFYGLFVITVRPGLAITVPLVLFGLFRYWYIAESGSASESPTDAVWADGPLIATVLGWGALCGAVLLRHRFVGP